MTDAAVLSAKRMMGALRTWQRLAALDPDRSAAAACAICTELHALSETEAQTLRRITQ